MDLVSREALTLFGTTLLNTLQNRPAVSLLRLILGEAVRQPMVAEMRPRSGRKAVSASYRAALAQQMERACCAAPTQARRRAVLSAR